MQGSSHCSKITNKCRLRREIFVIQCTFIIPFCDGRFFKFCIPFVWSQDKGVHITAIGIGTNVDKGELEKIAGERGTVVRVPNFESLSGELNGILEKVCGK